ncbi:MAG: Gfo/Idh/MocA family oxidoreductase, partial [Thermosynechococcaceae cyanobacterium]
VHLPALNDCPLTQPIAIYHRDRSKAEAIAQTHQIPFASDNLAELLARPEVHTVSISTPPFQHYDMTVQALEAGKPVFLEKPVTLNAQEARALYQRSRSQALPVVPNFEFRFVPAWMALKAQLDAFYVGKLRLVTINWLVPGRADPNRPWSWHASAEAGGGSLGALGSHTFDYIAWLFGPVKQVCGRLKTSIGHRPDALSGMPKIADADDTCLVMLELTDGTPVQVNISATAYNGRGHWVEVYGDRGALVLGSDNPSDYVHGFKLWGSQSGETLSELPIPLAFEFAKTYPDGRIAPVTRAIHHWADCILNRKTTAPSMAEGVYSQLLMDCTHESHETGCWVDVPDLEAFLEKIGP